MADKKDSKMMLMNLMSFIMVTTFLKEEGLLVLADEQRHELCDRYLLYMDMQSEKAFQEAEARRERDRLILESRES